MNPNTLIYTRWTRDGHSWRVLSQYATRAEAGVPCEDIVTRNGDAMDRLIRSNPRGVFAVGERVKCIDAAENHCNFLIDGDVYDVEQTTIDSKGKLRVGLLGMATMFLADRFRLDLRERVAREEFA